VIILPGLRRSKEARHGRVKKLQRLGLYRSRMSGETDD